MKAEKGRKNPFEEKKERLMYMNSGESNKENMPRSLKRLEQKTRKP